ncbi:MAG: hypothetical protein ABH883_04800 [Candidatus Omnitrophota bacterium]
MKKKREYIPPVAHDLKYAVNDEINAQSPHCISGTSPSQQHCKSGMLPAGHCLPGMIAGNKCGPGHMPKGKCSVGSFVRWKS